jgi:sugar lactone lactonase YvrE
LKTGLPGPDDLAFLPDGRLLFSDIRAGTVSVLGSDGTVVTIARGLSAPEGMVIAGDGRLLIAEQGRNRVMAVDLSSHALTLWRGFPNHTGRDGLDGIGPLLPTGDVIVPDSPNGVVWRVSADGKTATRIGAGMTRPVGAAVDPQGRVFVADEGGPLWVLEPGQRRLTALQTPDDVLVSKDGHLFVNTIGDNAIHELDASGHNVNLMRGIRGPQGIGLDGADNLYYTEFDAGRIARVVRTFVLDQATVSQTTRGTRLICPALRRAAGFTSPLTLTPGSSVASLILQLEQPGNDSSGGLELRTSQTSVTFSMGSGPFQLSQTVSVP